MKYFYSLAIAFLAIILSSAPATTKGADVVINSTNFPDDHFRSVMLARYSYGILTERDIEEATEIDVSFLDIKSLKGIEYFTALTKLDCCYNELTSLDLSKNTALKTLDCHDNQLTSLDVSKNTALTELICFENQMTSLDVLGCTALTKLDCDDNKLTSLDVSKNTVLTWLECNRNQLTSLDVSNNTALERLECGSNPLVTLDVMNNTALTRLACCNNKLTSLDVSNNTALTDLFCWHNELTSLDVSGCTALTSLECQINQLTSLDVSKNTALEWLSCHSNPLTSLDVSKNTALKVLCCNNSQLTSLDVSGCTALSTLYCDGNQLTSLDVSKNTALTTLICHENQLTSLDVSKNTALKHLGCDGNELTSLDVSKNTKLTGLYCQRNKIKGGNMDNLISSLPQNTTASTYYFVVYDNSKGDECNVCTKSQVAAVKAKGWTPQYYDVTEKKWKEYEGSEDTIEETDISLFDNVIYVDNMEVQKGSQTFISFKMKNLSQICAFQFDLYLPKGVTVVKYSRGIIQGALNDGRLYDGDNHALNFSELEGGIIRVLCTSPSNLNFVGNEGEIATLKVNIADDMIEGDYAIRMKDIKLVRDNGVKIYTEQVQSKLTVVSYIPGDANSDGEVDVADVVAIVNYILEKPAENFNQAAADVNDDNEIDAADVVGVVNIILDKGNVNAARVRAVLRESGFIF